MSCRTDTERLDWMQDGRWEIGTDSDGWQVRTYRRDGRRGTLITFNGLSLRETINLAMEDDLLKVMDVQRKLKPSRDPKP